MPALGRIWDSLRLSLDVLLDPCALVAPDVHLAIAAVVLAAIWGDRRLALFVGTLLVLLILGGAWVSAAFTDLPISADEAVNPIVRYTGADRPPVRRLRVPSSSRACGRGSRPESEAAP